MSRFLTLLLFALSVPVAVVCLEAPTQAAKNKKVATTLSEVGADFAFQGEYTGRILVSDSGSCYYWQRVGLQVVARGEGRFLAVQYPGGLPGSGWNGEEKTRWKGQRKDHVVRLSHDSRRILIEKDWAAVRDAHGCFLGHLHKVHRVSSTLGAAPPCGATVLFDGTNTDHFRKGRISEEGWLKEGARTRETFRNYTLHLEFRLPYMPEARGQGRANSGIYLQSRYEVQILDSFGLEGKNNECGGLYKYKEPDLNMCFPPLSWQTYDIRFTAPRFNEQGEKVRDARLTVWHNGVLIHDDVKLTRKTGSGSQEGPEALPIEFQNHGNPVRFRNIWIVEHDNLQQRRPSRRPYASNRSAEQCWTGPKEQCWWRRILD